MDASEWNKRYETSELIWSAQANQFVEAETRDLRPGRALDFAAGEGRNAIWLAQLGWRVTALDFSQVALDKGRQLCESQQMAATIDWVCADVSSWVPPPSIYDLIVVAYLHLPEGLLRKALRLALSGLAPGGRVVIVGHDLSNLEGGTGGPQDPAVLYTPQQIAGFLGEAGLDIVKATTVERQTPNGVAIDTLVTAEFPDEPESRS